MRARRLGFMAVMAVGLVVGWAGLASAKGPSKAQACEAAKLTAVGEKAECLASEAAGEVLGKTPKFDKCDRAFTRAFTKAEVKAGGQCQTTVATAAIEGQVDACIDGIAAALSGSPPPNTSQQFPATGQTTCRNSSGTVLPCAGTGQDGDIQAGAVLSYTDNGDGTITDNNTGLMWEKKSTDGTIHHKSTTYTWTDAFAVHVAGLNAGTGFAGHTDWRLPNVKELQSIINYENSPAVSLAFDAGCVAGCSVRACSCTQAYSSWSSTSYGGYPALAWVVHFGGGNVLAYDKGNNLFVRAVRGGS